MADILGVHIGHVGHVNRWFLGHAHTCRSDCSCVRSFVLDWATHVSKMRMR